MTARSVLDVLEDVGKDMPANLRAYAESVPIDDIPDTPIPPQITHATAEVRLSEMEEVKLRLAKLEGAVEGLYKLHRERAG